MKYKEFGDKTSPTIILLHSGGLSWWSFTDIIHLLKTEYHIVTPVIDGHDEDGLTTFISIQDSAQKLIQYIDTNYKGKVLAIGGVSLGAQIVVEVLSKKADIAKYAILESASVVPLTAITTRFMAFSCQLFYGIICKKSFAKMRAKAHCIKKDMFERYYEGSLNISKQSLVNIAMSNAGYAVPDALRNTEAKILIIIGSKEIRMMDKSVRKLMSMLPQSQVCIVPGMKHGEVSLVHCTEYLALINHFMA